MTIIEKEKKGSSTECMQDFRDNIFFYRAIIRLHLMVYNFEKRETMGAHMREDIRLVKIEIDARVREDEEINYSLERRKLFTLYFLVRECAFVQ
jgi:hypothetical protein